VLLQLLCLHCNRRHAFEPRPAALRAPAAPAACACMRTKS